MAWSRPTPLYKCGWFPSNRARTAKPLTSESFQKKHTTPSAHMGVTRGRMSGAVARCPSCWGRPRCPLDRWCPDFRAGSRISGPGPDVRAGRRMFGPCRLGRCYLGVMGSLFGPTMVMLKFYNFWSCFAIFVAFEFPVTKKGKTIFGHANEVRNV